MTADTADAAPTQEATAPESIVPNVGDDVVLKYYVNGVEKSITGTLSGQANGMAIVSNKKTAAIVADADVIGYFAVPEKSQKITVKVLKPVTPETVRSHLADRHAWTITQLNGQETETLLAAHENEHVLKPELAHKHGIKEKKAKKEQAPAAAASVSTETETAAVETEAETASV